eukprot:903611_1
MAEGESYSFIGRDNVHAYTKNKEGSFFSVDLKKHKVRPHAYTLKNYNKSEFALKSWNFEGTNDGKKWICLKEHKSDASLRQMYKSHTWTL